MKRRINVTNGAIVGAESTKRYVAEIKKAQVISREAETQLILDAQAGSLKARNVIIESNLRLNFLAITAGWERTGARRQHTVRLMLLMFVVIAVQILCLAQVLLLTSV